jgi:hypothetical protein
MIMTEEQGAAIITAYSNLMEIEQRAGTWSVNPLNHNAMLNAAIASVRELETVFPKLLDHLIPYRGETNE